MFSKIVAPALALLLSAGPALAAPVAEAGPSFHIDEAGALDVPNSIFSRLLPRSYQFHCSSGVRVWGVRGSTAVRGNNPMATFAHEIAQWAPGSFGSDLDYPALTNADLTTYVADSVNPGIALLTKRIQHYVDHCPGHRIAIFGYSQGAQVLGDTLIGSTDGSTQGLAQKYLDAITAVVQFADPAYVAGYGFDSGSPLATTNGAVYRANADRYVSTGLAAKMVSYCDEGDRWCSNQQWANSYDIHDNAPQTHGAQAIAFVQGKLQASGLN